MGQKRSIDGTKRPTKKQKVLHQGPAWSQPSPYSQAPPAHPQTQTLPQQMKTQTQQQTQQQIMANVTALLNQPQFQQLTNLLNALQNVSIPVDNIMDVDNLSIKTLETREKQFVANEIKILTDLQQLKQKYDKKRSLKLKELDNLKKDLDNLENDFAKDIFRVVSQYSSAQKGIFA